MTKLKTKAKAKAEPKAKYVPYKKKRYGKKAKAQYHEDLRARWNENKELAEIDKWKAVVKECDDMSIKASPVSITITAIGMEAAGFSGLPILDMKTFKKWYETGFIVKKGETSKVTGMSYMKAMSKDKDGKKTEKKDKEEEKTFSFPKAYKLFHRSQVEALV